MAEQLLQVWVCQVCSGSSFQGSRTPRGGRRGCGLCWGLGIPSQFFCVGSGVSSAPRASLLTSAPLHSLGRLRGPTSAGCRIHYSGWMQHKLGFALRNGQQGAAEGFELCFHLDPAVPPRTQGSCSNGTLNNFFQHRSPWLSWFG